MLLSTAIAVGFLGSFHCLGMCAPITWAMPDDPSVRWKWLGKKLTYNTGRIVTYGILGAIVGLAGQMLSFAGVQQWLSIGIGSVLVIMVLLSGMNSRSNPLVIKPIGRLMTWLKSKMGRLIQKKTWLSHFSLGMLNGLLPCGLVYVALVAAISMGSVSGGALYMLLFGLGTFPMMIAAAVLGRIIGQRFKHNMIRLVPKFIMVIGILFILRGLNLGVPYLSPKLSENRDLIECNTRINSDSFLALPEE